jgi:hypothetical protein
MEFMVRKFLPYYDPANQQQIMDRRSEGLRRGGMPYKTLRFGKLGGEFLVTVAYNRWGFRDPKDFAQSSTNDVFLVGDSFAFGWGVEQSNTFGAILEREMGTPVFNIAVPGGDFLDYDCQLKFAERHGGPVRNVILAVCMENDLLDYAKVDRAAFLAPPPVGKWSARRRLCAWLATRSALYSCAVGTLKNWDPLRKHLERLGLTCPMGDLDRPHVYEPGMLAASRDVLLEIAHRYNLTLLIIPSRRLWYGSNIAVEQRVHCEFVRMLQGAGLSVADMQPKLEASGDPLHFFFKHDPHLNPAGHAAAAATLIECLRSAETWRFLTNRPHLL